MSDSSPVALAHAAARRRAIGLGGTAPPRGGQAVVMDSPPGSRRGSAERSSQSLPLVDLGEDVRGSPFLATLQRAKEEYLKEMQELRRERHAMSIRLQRLEQEMSASQGLSTSQGEGGAERLEMSSFNNPHVPSSRRGSLTVPTGNHTAGNGAAGGSREDLSVGGSQKLTASGSWQEALREKFTSSAEARRQQSCLRQPDSPGRSGLRTSCTVTSVESIHPIPFVLPDDVEQDYSEQETRHKRAAVIGSFIQNSNLLLRSCLLMWHAHARAMQKPLTFTLRPPLAVSGVDRSSQSSLFDPVLAHATRSTRFERHTQLDMQRVASHTDTAYKGWLIHPASQTRLVWDILGAIFLSYDVAMIPMSVFNLRESPFLVFMEWMTLVYWTLDMVMSCVTGVVKNGTTCMEVRVILRTYLRTWFPLDIVVVGPDWVFTIIALAQGSPEGSDTADSTRLLRYFRTARVARLLRLAKLQHIFRMMRDQIDSEMAFISVNIVKLVALLFVLNHYTAAVWYWIGSESKRNGRPNWVDEELLSMPDPSIAYWYTTAIHWSMCMFTPGSMGVEPHNVLERTYAIMVLLFGMVIFSSFVSSVTAAVAQLKMIRSDNSQELWLLRRFLKQREVEKDLAFRVLRYAEYSYKSDKDLLPESKVWALTLLSSQLRSEIKYEVNFPCLKVHPFFKHLGTLWAVSIKERLVTKVLFQKRLADGDLLYEDAVHATHMHFVVAGSLAYMDTSSGGDAEQGSAEGTTQKLQAVEWLCEPVLFTIWFHRGTARAFSESEVVSIDALEFCEAVALDIGSHRLARKYALKVVEHLNFIPRGRLSDVGSQLYLDDAEVSEMMESPQSGKAHNHHHHQHRFLWSRTRSCSDGFLARAPTM